MVYQVNPLQYEDSIVWLEKVFGVREEIILTQHQSKKPTNREDIVGYSVLMEETPYSDTKNKLFRRRVFFDDPAGIAPGEVLPGVRIELLDKP